MSDKLVVGFVGVGLMGWGMAKNLVEKGFSTLVTAHRKREAVDDLVKRGATEVANVEEMAKQADVIVLCVTGSPQVEENIAKIIKVMKPGLTIIDTSTAEPESTIKLAKLMAEHGGSLIDSPLSRTPAHAWEGELTSFVSGPADVLAKVKPIIDTWSGALITVSNTVGDAHALKLVNNLVSLGYAALWSECYATLGKLNVDPSIFREVIRNSGMVCGNFENFSKYVCDGDPNGHKFSLANGHKDLKYYKNMAENMGIERPISGSALAVFDKAIDGGMGDQFLPELIDSMRDK
ncbi:MAG: 3-hydroxyisobutyrate dehydrogenase [Hyphomicrobiales bacterium]|nr:NAD(P)-dependent oxidoreductase [Hyphomicrobiales bacterium]PCJ85182.1 MAG: 3-hydroxyisobutyrate dehydrogenase [Hyphomicrobiales bacterium]